jgi:hypothetical protein
MHHPNHAGLVDSRWLITIEPAESLHMNSTVTTFSIALQDHQRVNMEPDPVDLDQVVLQYWFNGPLDGTTDVPGNNLTASEAAWLPTSLFRLTCSDSSAEIGECQ